MSREATRKLRVPEPLPFAGVRSAKELENFLWDMEQYFKAAHIPESEKVSITSMYLNGDAKLWWRTRLEDGANAGRPPIDVWKDLKKELRDQFLPCNTAWVARDALKKLKHTASVRDYVKQFSSLMLDIKDMSEADKLYNFMSGLQTWAQLELRRQGVKELSTAMAAADGLVDFRQEKDEGEKREPKFKFKDKGKKKKHKGEEDDADVSKAKPNDAEKQTNGKRTFGCFICDGPHRARECPKKEKLSALVARDNQEGSEDEAFARVNPLQVRLNALRMETPAALVHVPVELKSVRTTAMVDTGASHNFVARRMADAWGLRMSKCPGSLKAVNTKAQPIDGITYAVPFKVGEWAGKVNFHVVPLDDFDVILGNDFMVKAKAAVMPFLGGLLIMDEKQPCFVQTVDALPVKGTSRMEKLTALQVLSRQEHGQGKLYKARDVGVKVQGAHGRKLVALDAGQSGEKFGGNAGMHEAELKLPKNVVMATDKEAALSTRTSTSIGGGGLSRP